MDEPQSACCMIVFGWEFGVSVSTMWLVKAWLLTLPPCFCNIDDVGEPFSGLGFFEGYLGFLVFCCCGVFLQFCSFIRILCFLGIVGVVCEG